MKQQSNIFNNRAGISIVEVIIASGILAGAAFFMANILHKEKYSEDYHNRVMSVRKDAFLVLEKRVRTSFDRRRNISAGVGIAHQGYSVGDGVVADKGTMEIRALFVVNDEDFHTTSCRVYDVKFYTSCLDSSTLSPGLLKRTADVDFSEVASAAGLDPALCLPGQRPIVYMDKEDYIGGSKLPAKKKAILPGKTDNFKNKNEVISAALGFENNEGYVTVKLAIGIFDYAGKYNIILKTIYLGTGQYIRYGVVKNICSAPEDCCIDEYDYDPT